MSKLTDKISYLQGLAEGMKLNPDKDSHRLILGILDLLLGVGGLFALKIAKLGTVEAIVSPTLFALLVLGGALLLAAVVLLILKGKRKSRAPAQAA